MKKLLVMFLIFLMLCGCRVKEEKTEKINVVTTIFPLYDFARQVGGDKVEVTMLIDPGTEVHSFDPAPSDMVSIYSADLMIIIGGESDTWTKSVIAENKVKTLKMIDEVESIFEDHHHEYDEHIWTSPENAVKMLEAVCRQLSLIDSQNKEYFEENCKNYTEKIKNADNKIRATVNKTDNPFILVADRFPFAYFTKYYGIEYEAAFGGCAVTNDISLKTMNRLLDTIKEKNIKTVYCAELSNCTVANALKEETGVKIEELHSAHTLSKEDFESGKTYVDIMLQNQKALERGLLE